MNQLVVDINNKIKPKYPVDWTCSGGRFTIIIRVVDLPRMYEIASYITSTNRRWLNNQQPMTHTHNANEPATLENEISTWADFVWDQKTDALTTDEWRFERCVDPELWPADMFPNNPTIRKVRDAIQARKDDLAARARKGPAQSAPPIEVLSRTQSEEIEKEEGAV